MCVILGRSTTARKYRGHRYNLNYDLGTFISTLDKDWVLSRRENVQCGPILL